MHNGGNYLQAGRSQIGLDHTRSLEASKLSAVYFGHHKAATKFLSQILEDSCKMIGINHAAVANPAWIDFDFPRFISANSIKCLSYVNSNINFAQSLQFCRGVHIIRDPRDMAISAYFSHRYSHPLARWPELLDHRKRLDAIDLKAGLLLDFQFTDDLVTDGYKISVFPAMRNWRYNNPSILELRFEDLLGDFEVEMTKILTYLFHLDSSDPRTISRIRSLLQINSFNMMTGGRLPGEMDPYHHYRKGVIGDWRQYFSQEHKMWFKERYGDFLIEHGYERSYDW